MHARPPSVPPRCHGARSAVSFCAPSHRVHTALQTNFAHAMLFETIVLCFGAATSEASHVSLGLLPFGSSTPAGGLRKPTPHYIICLGPGPLGGHNAFQGRFALVKRICIDSRVERSCMRCPWMMRESDLSHCSD